MICKACKCRILDDYIEKSEGICKGCKDKSSLYEDGYCAGFSMKCPEAHKNCNACETLQAYIRLPY